MTAEWGAGESDRRLIMKALRERWEISDQKWREIVARQVDIASGGDPDATPKDSVAAFKTLLAAMQQAAGDVPAVVDRRRTTVNIGAVVNADGNANKGIALLERFRASGILGGADGTAGEQPDGSDGGVAGGEGGGGAADAAK